MTKEETLTLLESLPKKTPIWAVGLVSLVVSVSASFVIIYTTARPEVQQYLASNLKDRDLAAALSLKDRESAAALSLKDRESRANVESIALASLLEQVKNNSSQLTVMGTTLNTVTIENIKLSERLSVVEKDLILAKKDLSGCEAELKTYKKGR